VITPKDSKARLVFSAKPVNLDIVNYAVKGLMKLYIVTISWYLQSQEKLISIEEIIFLF
jgi:hypothetical protein